MFEVGEIVFLRCPPIYTGTSTKIQPKYRGPLVVTKVFEGDTYKIAAVRPTHRRLYATTAHVSLLKPFNNQTEVEDGTEDEDYESSVHSYNVDPPQLLVPEEVLVDLRPKRAIKLPKRLEHFHM